MRMLLVMMALLMALPAGAAEQPTVFGVWLTEAGESKLEIFPCAEKACARVVWMKYPAYRNAKDGPVGMEKVDRNNPDPSLRNRPILGMQVMEGLAPEGDWWKNGSCYDPQSGKKYQCKMHLESPTELKLRGFIGISLLGRSYTLTRDTAQPTRTAQNREGKVEYH